MQDFSLSLSLSLSLFLCAQGQFMFHCHNLAHEDNDMMRAFEVSGPNQVPGYPDSPLPENIATFDPMSTTKKTTQ
jgi:hypothetical protein